ncbi:MAG: hypothetical protein AAF458_09430 [Pseudomonadota bacterium]
MKTTTILLLTLSALGASVGQVLFKVGATGRTTPLEFVNPYIVGGGILYATATSVWIYALAHEKLVNVYAFTALTFVFVYIGGVVLLRESLSTPAAFGVGLVLVGLYLVTSNG